MIISVYIKNFKAYERETISLNKNNVISVKKRKADINTLKTMLK